MSLVDYASSDGEEDQEDAPIKQPQLHPQPSTTTSSDAPSQSKSLQSQSIKSSSNQSSKDVSPSPIGNLPDASLLLSSPISSQQTGSDHFSRVAAAMAENASRKREANGPSSSNIRGKIPRGNLPHTKDIPDTSSGVLMPPQLRGRSNVVTEDINKLFVRRNSQGKT
ncbi:uncharacterized protein LOC110704401 isoform X1 [Chenopodium quinoa]|nr:uncharacterized protein LOC110704401 isoform X1 [Chenopodium quinoa]